MKQMAAGLVAVLVALGACARATGNIDEGEGDGATGAGGSPKATTAATAAGGRDAGPGAGGSPSSSSTTSSTFERPCAAVQSCATQGSTNTCTELDSGWDELAAKSQCGSSYKAEPCDPTGAVGGCLDRDAGRCSIVWYYPPTYVASTIDALCTGLGKQVVPGPP